MQRIIIIIGLVLVAIISVVFKPNDLTSHSSFTQEVMDEMKFSTEAEVLRFFYLGYERQNPWFHYAVSCPVLKNQVKSQDTEIKKRNSFLNYEVIDLNFISETEHYYKIKLISSNIKDPDLIFSLYLIHEDHWCINQIKEEHQVK